MFTVTNNGTDFEVAGHGTNPTLAVARGSTVVFNIAGSGPVYLKTTNVAGNDADVENRGVSNNGIADGILRFVVPRQGPTTLFLKHDSLSAAVVTLNIAAKGEVPFTPISTPLNTSSSRSHFNPMSSHVSSKLQNLR